MSWRHGGALAALALVSFCLAVAPAEARIFSERLTLSPPGESAGPPQVVIDSQDRATVAWALRLEGGTGAIQAVRLDASGDPGPVLTLSEPGMRVNSPQLAIDSEDRVTVVWSTKWPALVQSVRLGAAGTPEGMQTLSDLDHEAFPQIAIDSQDRATVVWTRRLSQTAVVESVRIDADGTPGEVLSLSNSEHTAYAPLVVLDSQARATVAWRRAAESGERLEWVRLDADRQPGPVHTHSAPGVLRHPLLELAVDSEDNVTLAWSSTDFVVWNGPFDFYDCCGRIEAVRFGADGTVGDVQELAPYTLFGPFLAVDSQDRAILTWQAAGLNWAQLGADGELLGTRMHPEGVAGAIAIDSQDRASVIAWSERVTWLRLGPDGDLLALRPLAPGGAMLLTPRHAIDSEGRTTVVWGRWIGSKYRVQVTREGDVLSTPETELTGGPPADGTILQARPSFQFTGTPPDWIERFECSLDEAPFQACKSPHRFEAALPAGPHTFRVRAVDDEGDADPTPAARSFKVSRAGLKRCVRRARRGHARALRRASRLRFAKRRRGARKRAAQRRRGAIDKCRVRFL